MKVAQRPVLLTVGLSLLPHALWGQAVPSVQEALARIRENVGKFETSLPDFVCDEKVTSRRVVNGKTTAETVTDSTIVGTMKDFLEAREIAAVNGKQVTRARTLKGPYIYLDGFSSTLIVTFGPKWTPHHDYHVVGMESVGGRTLLAIEFATKEGQTQLFREFWRTGIFSGKSQNMPSKDTGKAWIDPESMQVIRLERHHLNLPPWVTSEIVSTDYAIATIDGKPFWMPKITQAEDVEPLGKSKPPAYKYCTAEYSNYRKFEASSAIKY